MQLSMEIRRCLSLRIRPRPHMRKRGKGKAGGAQLKTRLAQRKTLTNRKTGLRPRERQAPYLLPPGRVIARCCPQRQAGAGQPPEATEGESDVRPLLGPLPRRHAGRSRNGSDAASLEPVLRHHRPAPSQRHA
jgi:hypothetical protein